MQGRRAAAAVFASVVVMAACGRSPELQRSGLLAAQPSRSPSSPADVRFTFEELLGQHCTLAVRAMRATVRGAPDTAEATDKAVVANRDDLGASVESLHGEKARKKFEELWDEHTEYLLDYAEAVAKGDQAAQDRARLELYEYRDLFSEFVESTTGRGTTVNPENLNLQVHLDQLTGQLDAYDAGDLARAYQLQREAFAHMFPTGTALAGALGRHLPGEFPVAVDDASQRLRSNLGKLLGEHFELAVDVMRAGTRGGDDFAAAAAALAANTSEMTAAIDGLFGARQAAEFNRVWSEHIDLLVRYTVAVAQRDGGAREKVRGQLAAVRQPLGAAFSRATGGRVPVDVAVQALSVHDDQLLRQADAYAARDFRTAHDLSFAGFDHMLDTAASLAAGIEGEVTGRMPVGGSSTGGGGTAP